MEWLSTFFLGAFLFGLVFSLASLLLGFGQHSLHFGAHGQGGLHFGAHGHGGLHLGGGVPDVDGLDGSGAPRLVSFGSAQAASAASPWSITGLMAFIAWFGGVGYLALTEWQLAAWISLLGAGLAGLAGWWLLYLFSSRVLSRGEHVMDPADYQMEGTVARVTVPIAAGRIGEIQYAKGGVRRSDGARSLDGSAIPRSAEVVVVRYERGIAYVQPWREFVDGEAPAGAEKG
jgi:hypothetical protein